MMPWRAGCVPVESEAEFTRVTVGNTEWLFSKMTPSFPRRNKIGVSFAVMASGRNPSITKTRWRAAFAGACANAECRPQNARTRIKGGSAARPVRFDSRRLHQCSRGMTITAFSKQAVHFASFALRGHTVTYFGSKPPFHYRI